MQYASADCFGKIHSSMYHRLQTRGYAAPVDVLIDTVMVSIRLPKHHSNAYVAFVHTRWYDSHAV